MPGWSGLSVHVMIVASNLIKVQQLLFIVVDAVVGVGIMCSELDGCNVICQSSLLLIVKAS